MNKQEKELLLKKYRESVKHYWSYDAQDDCEMKAYELGKKDIIKMLLPEMDLFKIDAEVLENVD